ncbi:HEPN domain-containing protein [archaeon]|nr:HEPN domain-containing protein [archaeon]
MDKLSFDLESLIEKDHLTRIAPDPKSATKELMEARRDLASSEKDIRSGDIKWVLVKAYYSMFHAAKAILFLLGLKERRHYAVRKVLEWLVYKGKLEKRYVNDFNSMMDAREDADYELAYKPEQAPYALKTAADFLKEMERQAARISAANRLK